MADRRRRFRNKKTTEDARQGPAPAPITIARREDARIAVVQPKILLKKEADSGTGSSSSTYEQPIIKTIYVNRSEPRPGQAKHISIASPNTCGTVCSSLATNSSSGSSRDKTDGLATGNAAAGAESVPRMTRPAPLLVASGVFNANARKMFHKTNTDFTVIGVLGAQAVGKSTLLNLLTAERPNDYDHYRHLLAPTANECVFPTRPKAKSQKNVLRPRTETTHFFITKERHVLLDTAPLLANVNLKETDHLDLQSLATVVQLLTVCHVLLLALNELNLEHVRLLHAALRLRTRSFGKGCVKPSLPHVLFVRTRAQRHDFEPALRARLERQLEQLYGGTGLHIYRGRGEARTVNCLLLPEFSGNAATTYHAALGDMARELRERVLATTRAHLSHSNDCSETLWFELLAESVRRSTQHFEKIYADQKLRHLNAHKKRRYECWRSAHD